MSKITPQNPEHYQGEIQPIDYIVAHKLGFCEGNIVKYITRWQYKNGLEDLLKAKTYLEFLINIVEVGKPRKALSNCERCGKNENYLAVIQSGSGNFAEYWVACAECGVESPKLKSRTSAIEAWNKGEQL